MTSTQRKRLAKLADFLDTKVPRKRFVMSNFFRPQGSFWGDSEAPLSLSAECGTSACALGWATVCFPRTHPTVREETGFTVAREVFGVSTDDANDLFYGPEVTPKQKAKEIRRYLARV